MQDHILDGTTIILIDYNTHILFEVDYLIELGPKACADGGTIIAQVILEEIENNENS